MQFFGSVVLAVAALVTLASANSIQFFNNDDRARNVVFAPGRRYPGGPLHESIPDLHLPGIKNNRVYINMPRDWAGNWRAVPEGVPRNNPAVLGEAKWQGANGLTYFDVSAVDSSDNQGVHYVTVRTFQPLSGCRWFNCPDAYINPNDKQTKSTPMVDLICTVGQYAN